LFNRGKEIAASKGLILADTKYVYTVGTKDKVLAEGTSYYFVTSPEPITTKPLRIWAMGDFGDLSTAKYVDNQAAVRKQFLKNRNELIADKIYFLTYPKNLQLEKPTIISNISKKNNTWTIRLKTDVLAKNIYLKFKDIEGFFSDNYFDLVPGDERIITFRCKSNSQTTPKLEIISLVDSYK
jgi:hypothetical protein